MNLLFEILEEKKKKKMDSINFLKENGFKIAFITNAGYDINLKSEEWGWDLYVTHETDKIEFKKYQV